MSFEPQSVGALLFALLAARMAYRIHRESAWHYWTWVWWGLAVSSLLFAGVSWLNRPALTSHALSLVLAVLCAGALATGIGRVRSGPTG
ncbi:MAG: hypothetical protein K2R93_15995 [Gemmatimonadaceae bacterium]|nr:hypothetical protein [Gemmatimonadaceae bacterium]